MRKALSFMPATEKILAEKGLIKAAPTLKTTEALIAEARELLKKIKGEAARR
jgi:hypothetical protein